MEEHKKEKQIAKEKKVKNEEILTRISSQASMLPHKILMRQ